MDTITECAGIAVCRYDVVRKVPNAGGEECGMWHVFVSYRGRSLHRTLGLTFEVFGLSAIHTLFYMRCYEHVIDTHFLPKYGESNYNGKQ